MSRILSTFRVATALLSKPVYRTCTFNLIPQSFKHELKTVSFTTLSSKFISSPSQGITKYVNSSFLEPKPVSTDQIRTVIKFSLQKGRRKSVNPVRKRFFRLNWGIWIRTIAGRKNHKWKKTAKCRNRALQHVFCNATQSRKLDIMVSKFWRKPKYYIDDPYEPYHTREEFHITRRKPWRPEGVDYE